MTRDEEPAPPSPAAPVTPTSAIHHRRTSWLLMLAVLVGGILRFWSLGDLPLTNDEQNYTAISMAPEEFVPFSRQRDLRTAGLIEGRQAQPVLSAQLKHYFVYSWMSRSGFAARAVNATLGTATIALLALLAWRLWGRWEPGVLAAWLMALSPFDIRFHRSAYTDPPFQFFILLSLWFHHRMQERPGIVRGICWGAAAALMASTKISAPIFLAAEALIACAWLRHRKPREVLPGLAAALVAFTTIFVIENDPLIYLQAIFAPTDAKYRVGLLGMLEKSVFHHAWWMWLLGIVGWLLPLTLIPLVAIGASAFRNERRSGLIVGLWICCATPLLIMHTPLVSGEHGLLPLTIPLFIMASGTAISFAATQLHRQRIAIFMGLHFVVASALSIVFGMAYAAVPFETYYNYRRDSLPGLTIVQQVAESLPERSRICLLQGDKNTVRSIILTVRQPVVAGIINPHLFSPQALRLADVFIGADDIGTDPLPGFDPPTVTSLGEDRFVVYQRTTPGSEWIPLEQLNGRMIKGIAYFELPSGFAPFASMLEVRGPASKPLNFVTDLDTQLVPDDYRVEDNGLAGTLNPATGSIAGYEARLLPAHPFRTYGRPYRDVLKMIE